MSHYSEGYHYSDFFKTPRPKNFMQVYIPADNTSYSYSASTVNFYHVEPDSHFWSDLNMILTHEKLAPQYLTKEYLLTGLKNTLEHGYHIAPVKKLNLNELTYLIFPSISDMIEYVNKQYFDMDEFCLIINTTLNIGLNLTNGLKMERKEVYKILDGERDYQDNTWVARRTANGTPDKEKSIAEWLTYIEHHLEKVKYAIYYLNDNEALAEIRKVTALGIRAMEIHGCPERKIGKIINPLSDIDPITGKLKKDDKCEGNGRCDY